MIVDVHTHVFPPEVRDNRDAYLERDATFREIYADPSVPIATADELLTSMDEAAIDCSVISGFAWSDADLCRAHSDYILEAASASAGRLVPFCTVQPSADGTRDEIKRLAVRGARGLGELRPQQQGYGLIDSEEADLLAWAADAYDLVLLLHASEPVGPPYPGKSGLPIEQLGRFIEDFSNVNVIAAHWGGGLPFFALMPEMERAMSGTYFDTAGTASRYESAVYAQAVALVGAERILFGSGFPRTSQQAALAEVHAAPIDGEAKNLILGENTRRLLRLG